MNNGDETLFIRALTPGELAVLYRVTTKTLKTWIDKHSARVGERYSKYYTSLQVKMIFECIGLPVEVVKEGGRGL